MFFNIKSSILIIQFVCLITWFDHSAAKSIESKLNNLSSILKETDKNGQIVNLMHTKEIKKSSNGPTSQQIIDNLRHSLAELPGEPIGRLIKKRNTYLNVSSIELLLELETSGVEMKDDQAGCFIEIKIIKRIPGRCAIIDGETVCKADNYYKKNDECSNS